MSDPIDLGLALDGIVAAISAQFPTFKTVVAEDESRTELKVPAIVVQISELEPDPEKDPHTGQYPCMVRLEARVIMGHRTAQVRREIAKAAGALAAFTNSNRFGTPWGAAVILSCEPDEFDPEARQFDIWRVEWAHQADLGPSYFVDEGVTPEMVLTSWAPEIGPDHVVGPFDGYPAAEGATLFSDFGEDLHGTPSDGPYREGDYVAIAGEESPDE